MTRQYRGKAPRKNDIRYTKRLETCPICDRVLPQCSISVGGCVSVCPGCLKEWQRRNDPKEVRNCVICGEPTTTPYAILPGGEVTCCEECDDDHLRGNEFLYEDEDIRSTDRY